MRKWVERKAKVKQGKNVASAIAQALSSVHIAIGMIEERDGSLLVALDSPVVKQTVERHAERIASFSGGPMHSDELWREVYDPVISEIEQSIDVLIAPVFTNMLTSAFLLAIDTGTVKRSPSN